MIVDEVKMEFLYNDGDDYYFMDEAYEQTMLKHEVLGDAVEYLTPNLSISVSFHDGRAVGIELPTAVVMTVMETEPGIKVRDSFFGDEAGEDGDWFDRAGSPVHQRGARRSRWIRLKALT